MRNCPKCSNGTLVYPLLPSRSVGLFFCGNCNCYYDRDGDPVKDEPEGKVRFDWKPGKDELIAHALGVKLDDEMPEVKHQ